MQITHLLKGACRPLCLLVLVVVFPCVLTAQDICPIKIVGENTPVKQRRIALEPISVEGDGVQWDNLSGLFARGGTLTSVSLEPGQRSQILWLKNVNASIPASASVESIQLQIFGSQTGEGIVDRTIQWYDASTGLIGDNKANDVLGGVKPWTDNQIWKYGTPGDLWSLGSNPEILNNPATGMYIQLENNGDEVSTAEIDVAYIIITYRPAYDICEHDCVSFFVEDLGDNIQYNWSIPEGYHNIDNEPYDRVLNLGRDTTGYGLFEVCVQATSGFLSSDICCRNFRYGPCGTGSLGDRVWHDENVNGIQDEGEEGVPNLDLTLYNYNNEAVGSTQTDAEGFYLFDLLEKGNYRVSVEVPEPYMQTIEAAEESVNSDFVRAYGSGSSFVYVDETESYLDLDFGLIKTGEIGDYVWFDENRNGIQDDHEQGIAGVTLSLLDTNEQIISIVSTDASGFYLFEDVYPGEYSILIELPDENYEITTRNIGETTTDSDFYLDGQKITTGSFEVWSGQINRDLDAGFRWQTGEVNGLAWYDDCGDGQLDIEDALLPNILVSLYDCQANFVASTFTNDEGYYHFEEVIIGDYYLVFESLNGHIFLDQSAADSEVDNSNGLGSTSCFTVQNNTETNVNAGYTQLASLGDYVWLDANTNGIQDVDEAGLQGVEVLLKNREDELIASEITLSNGNYLFENIYPGRYYIEFLLLENHLFTDANIGQENLDSDVDGSISINSTSEILIKANEINLDIDAGMRLNAGKVEGYTWHDENFNGLQESSEQAIANIEVQLFNCTGEFIASTITDEEGNYVFCDILVGEYYVHFGLQDHYAFTAPDLLPANLNSDVNASSGSGTTDCVGVILDETTSFDAGYYMPVCIGDFVWLDANQNGIQNVGEVGVEDVAVSLLSAEGELLESVVTNAQGFYQFTDLDPGSYYLQFAISDMFLFTTSSGADPTLNSDVTNANGEGTSSIINLSSGVKDYSIDAGLIYSTRSISGTTWIDENCDGILQADELRKGALLVELLDEFGNILDTRITDVEGNYNFSSVPIGTYKLRFPLSNQLDFTLENQGNDPNLDSDAIAANNGQTADILIDGTTDVTGVNAGYKYKTEAIEGYVWADCKVDGIQQTNESAIANVWVNLHNPDGSIHQSTLTNAAGQYALTGILFNEYYLSIEIDDSMYMLSFANEGNNDNIDSDFLNQSGNFETLIFDLDDSMVFDAGFYRYARLAGSAWFDEDTDGLLEPNEEGVEGVRVYLMDEFMNVVADQTTDVNGGYAFEEVVPGIYNLGFDKHPDLVFSSPDLSGDSDIVLIEEDRAITTSFVLKCGENLADVNAAYEEAPPLASSISGVVFEDFNADGINENTGFFINQEVSLYRENGELVSTTQTNEVGAYDFVILTPGSYYVVFENEYELSPFQVGDDMLDSDAQIVNGVIRTDHLLVMPDTHFDHVDAGFFSLATIGDYVWFDSNKNGLQDQDELGVPNQMVMLFTEDDQLVESLSTDTDGLYSFVDVRPGTYYVSFGLVDGYEFTLANQGSNDLFDSDVNNTAGFTGNTALITLISGEENTGVDAGMSESELESGSLSGHVFEDLNANGIQENDPLVNEMVVTLFDGDGLFVEGKSTDENGFYQFSELAPGDYYIVFGFAEDQISTWLNIGNDEALDSDVSLEDGEVRTAIVSLEAGENLGEIDAGFYRYASLGDLTWIDLNGNGKRNVNDIGLSNVEIMLYNADNDLVGIRTTNEEGLFLFDALRPGQYFLTFGNVEDYEFTEAKVGTNDFIDSDVISDTGNTSLITLNSGESNLNIDAGYEEIELVDPPVFNASISGEVFEDLNADGLKTSNQGLAEMTLTLFNELGEVVASTNTNNNGKYFFTSLMAGQYTVSLDIGPDFEWSPYQVGNDAAIDSDFQESQTGILTTEIIILDEDESVINVDAGLWRYASIGDLAWFDLNENGKRNVSDYGLDSIAVSLFTADDEQIDSAITDTEGLYLFTNVVPGDYYLVFSSKDSLLFTLSNIGTNETNDSDVNDETGRTDVVSVQSGDVNLNMDAGYIQEVIVDPPLIYGSISGQVFEDMNADGLNSENVALSNVELRLFNTEGDLLDEQLTDENGLYRFDDLVEGSYEVVVDAGDLYQLSPTNIGTDDAIDSDFNEEQAGGMIVELDLSEGENRSNLDAGLWRYASIGDLAWFDLNENGKRNVSDYGLDSIAVSLFTADDEQIDSAITDTEGLYLFTNVVPGDYYLVFSSKDSLLFTLSNIGTNETNDSDVSDESGRTDVISVQSGDVNLNMDAGYIQEVIVDPPIIYGSISGQVFEDMNADGLNSENVALSGVELRLLNEEGDLLDEQLTDENGLYRFDDLVAGSYEVVIDAGDLYQLSPTNIGTDDAIDSDFNEEQAGGIMVELDLSDGENRNNLDAGFWRFASVGDFVWYDLNENGKQNPGEPGVDSIDVTLFSADDVALQTTMSSENGEYMLTNVVPGDYYLQFSRKAELRFAKANVGANESNDSDVVDLESGTTEVFSLVSGLTRVNIDAGYRDELEDPIELGSICGFLYEDMLADGVSLDDPGLADMTIAIFTEEDDFIESTLTGANGEYCFTDLPEGSYYLQLNAPDNYNISEANIGSNDAIDFDFSTGLNGITTALIPLAENEDIANVDAGVWRFVSVGDYAWLDINENGLQNQTEPGVDSIKVSLFDDADDLIEDVLTGEDGAYLFEGLRPGNYYLNFSLKDSLDYTTSNATANVFIDSDAAEDTGDTDVFILRSGSGILDMDAGYVMVETPMQNGAISGFVFEDLMADGVKTDDPGLGNRTVRLFDAQGLLATSSTDENGFYGFSNLPAGNYNVQVELNPDYQVTAFQEGVDAGIDNDFLKIDDTFRTINLSLNADEAIVDVDCGVYNLAEFAGFVWLDENGDGIRQSDEAGFADVNVVLLDAFGTSFGSVDTDEDGLYRLSVIPGSYMLGVITPNGFFYTEENQGSDETLDSDIISTLGPFGISEEMSVISGQVIDQIGAGLRMDPIQGAFNISGKVIEDLNGNGLQNPNDPALAEIEVSLFTMDTILVANEMTNMAGEYLFENLPAEDYFIVIDLAENMELSYYQTGSDASIDSDFQLDGEFRRTVTLSISSESIENIDALVYRFARIGDYVWNDLDENGVQGLDESGLEGVQIILFDNGNNEIASVSSGENGQYAFESLRPGNYRVNFVLPKYYLFSEGLQGSDGSADSDVVLSFGDIGTTNFIPITSGETNVDIDGGVYLDPSVDPKSFMFGYVWDDLNADGILGDAEPGTNGVEVSLRDGSGAVLDTKTTANHPETNEPGYYEFTVLSEGMYYVSFDLPSGVILTDANIGLDELEDSDVSDSGGELRTEVYDLVFGDVVQGVNAGYYRNADLTGYIWFDENQNGIQNDAEEGLEGFNIRLYRNDGTLTSMSTSNENGQYSFTSIKPGNFFLRVDLVNGVAITIPNQGSDDSVDSDVDGSNGPNGTANFNLNSGVLEVNWDIGLILEPSSIGNFVWDDLNGDGLQSEDEPGINDVIVDLYHEDGSLRATTTTQTQDGVAGFYLFEEIEPGNYYVRFQAPPEYLFVIPYQGANAAFDSNVTEAVASGSTDVFLLGPGLFLDDIDAGLYRESTIGDLVWDDANRNGIRDANESGLANIPVTLYRAGYGDYGTQITDNNGSYTFDQLPAGEYYISVALEDALQFSLQNMGSEDEDSDVNAAGNSELFLLAYEEDKSDVDVGVHASTGLIGKEVWLDVNGNGLKDFNEALMTDIRVNLLNDEGDVLRSTITDHVGQYTFDNLDPGNYQIEFEAPEGYEFTKKNQGFDESLDSDVSEEGMSDMVFIDPSNIVRDLDAGIFEEGTVKPEVWFDENGNGVRELGEASSNEFTLELFDEFDERVLTSDQYVLEGGKWSLKFEGLAPGEYYLRLAKPNNYKATLLQKSNDLIDNIGYDIEEWVYTKRFSLKSGETLESIKIGLVAEEKLDVLSAKIYPNPAADYLVVSWDSSLKETSKLVYIYDQLGTLVFEREFDEKGSEKQLIKINDLLPGAYQLYIYADNKRYGKQFIKM